MSNESGRWKALKERILSSRPGRTALVIAAIAIFLLLLLELTLPTEKNVWQSLIERVVDAFVVAALLYLIFDGPAKAEITNATAARVSHEWRNMSEEGLWVLLNKEAWQEHRDMVIKMARKKTYLSRVDWKITFDTDPTSEDLLRLSVHVESHGQSFDDSGTFPRGDAPLLASSDGRESRYTGLSLRAIEEPNDKHRQIIDVQEAYINDPTNELVGKRDDHAITLDMDRLRRKFSESGLKKGERFILKNETRVFRHRRGFFPMWTLWTACDNAVTVVNNTGLDLKFTLARLHELEVFTLTPDKAQSIDLLPPGCAFILAWAEARNEGA